MNTGVEYNIAAIETVYKGILFRSRLEAQWVYRFDRLGWRWDYEPLEFNGYIPDFVLHFKKPTLIEVKPGLSTGELARMGRKAFHAVNGRHPLIMLGAVSDMGAEGESGWLPVVGVQLHSEEDGPFSEPMSYDPVCLFWCLFCQKPSLNDFYGSYACKLNGCYDGDHYLSDFPRWPKIWAASKKRFRHKPRVTYECVL